MPQKEESPKPLSFLSESFVLPLIHAIVAVLTFLASRGLDRMISKWVTYFVSRYEEGITEQARRRFYRITKEMGASRDSKELLDWKKRHLP